MSTTPVNNTDNRQKASFCHALTFVYYASRNAVRQACKVGFLVKFICFVFVYVSYAHDDTFWGKLKHASPATIPRVICLIATRKCLPLVWIIRSISQF